MSKKIFTEKEIKQLSKNKYVKSVSSKGITYTDELTWGWIESNQQVRDGKKFTVRTG